MLYTHWQYWLVCTIGVLLFLALVALDQHLARLVRRLLGDAPQPADECFDTHSRTWPCDYAPGTGSRWVPGELPPPLS